MADQDGRHSEERDGMERVGSDATQASHIGFTGGDDAEINRVHLQMHERHNAHTPEHVDLRKDEYTPDEVARLAGTSKDAVMHAIYDGELKAEREGNSVVCISHKAVVDWLRRRGPGV